MPSPQWYEADEDDADRFIRKPSREEVMTKHVEAEREDTRPA